MDLRLTSGLLFLLCICWQPAFSANLEGNDLILTDGTPGIAFDDTDTGTGPSNWDWTIRGREEYFRIYDESDVTTFLQISPTLHSTALGWTASATGQISAAVGAAASASGDDSIAIGSGASANSEDSISVGKSASATGSNTIAIGDAATTLLNGGVALGEGAYTTKFAGTAVGRFTSAFGEHSAALGSQASALGDRSIALGFNTDANGVNSTALGARATSPNADTVILGAVAGSNGAIVSPAVGIGTYNPLSPLHVARSDGTARIYVEDTDAGAAPKTLFKIGSNFNAKFEIDNTDGALWAFTNAGTDFRISRQGSGVVEFQVFNNGNATLAGALTQNSDRHAKQDIEAVDPGEVLEKVTTLPVSTWTYKDAPGARHLGPMAQDFHAAFGLGESDTGISSIDTGGVALAAIQALNTKLETRNQALEAEVRELRELVMKMAAATTR